MLSKLILREFPYLLSGAINVWFYYNGGSAWNLSVGVALIALSLRDISDTYWKEPASELSSKNNPA